MPLKVNLPSVFVRGLPFNITDERLATHFSDVAPVKRAFVIRDKVTKEARGFGFVQFALDDDATEAAQKLNGSTFEGRKISVEVAKQQQEGIQSEPRASSVPDGVGKTGNVSKVEVRSLPTKRPRTEESSSGSAAEHQHAKRTKVEPQLLNSSTKETTLVLFGLSSDVDKKKLWVRIRKTQGAQRCDGPTPFPGSSTGCQVMIVTYDTARNAISGQKQLDGHNILGGMVAARRGLDVRVGTDAHATARLITRNLRFDASPQHIRNAIERHAPEAVRSSVVDIHVPLKAGSAMPAPVVAGASDDDEEEDEGKTEDEAEGETKADGAAVKAAKKPAKAKAPVITNRGFGFIQCATRSDAAALLAALNGKRVHKREVVVDWALPKGAAAAAAAAEAVVTDAAAAAKAASEAQVGIAVTADEEGEDSIMDKGEEEGDSEDDDEEEDEEAGGEGDDDDEDKDDEDDDEDDDSVDVKEKPNVLAISSVAGPPPVDPNDAARNTTLFLRNVSFDTVDGDLVEVFRSFGPVKYARIVVDQGSGRSKGTAFIQFYTKEGADRALAAGGVKDEHTDDFASPRAHESEADARKRARYADAVESALLDGGLRDKAGGAGRPLLVARARTHEEVKRSDALKAAEDGVGVGGRKYDGRHTYLAHEGTIRADSDVGALMPPTDAAKRDEATRAKKAKLSSPLFFVSPVRLSVRNMAKHVDDAGLKALAREAALMGIREALATPTEGDPRLMPAPGARHPPIKIVTAKVLRDTLEEGGAALPQGGKEDGKIVGKSKGFGFVEFGCHLHALAALRKLNNNPAYSKGYATGGSAAVKAGKKSVELPRLIVEFAVENAAKVKQHEARKAASSARREALVAAGVIKAPASKKGADNVGAVKNEKRAERSARKTAAREEKAAAAAAVRKEKKAAAGGAPTPPAVPAPPAVSDSVPAAPGGVQGPVVKAQPDDKRKERFDRKRKRREDRRAAAQLTGSTGAAPGSTSEVEGDSGSRPLKKVRFSGGGPASGAVGAAGKAQRGAHGRGEGADHGSADAELDAFLSDVTGQSLGSRRHSRAVSVDTLAGSVEGPGRRVGKRKAAAAEVRTDALIGDYMKRLYGM